MKTRWSEPNPVEIGFRHLMQGLGMLVLMVMVWSIFVWAGYECARQHDKMAECNPVVQDAQVR